MHKWENFMKEDSSIVSLSNRKILKLSGVKDIGKFDDNNTIVFTNLGKMKVIGSN